HFLGAGPGVIGGHLYGRRRDARKLRQGQRANRNRPRQGDDNRQHRGKDGPIDEESRNHGRCSLMGCYLLDPLPEATGMGTTSGWTAAPGLTRCRPLTTTFSPGLSPSVTTRRPSCSRPTLTRRYETWFASSTT